MDGNCVMRPGPKIALLKTPILLRPLAFFLTLSWVFLGWWPTAFNFPVGIQKAQAAELVGSWVTGTTHTAEAGSNRALILVTTRTGWNDIGETVTSATYGGQALVHVERVEEDSSSTGYYTQTEVWILDEAGIAAASSSTFVVNWTESSAVSHTSAFYQNVNQTTLIGLEPLILTAMP